jgi:hypothetical protein
MAPEQIRGRRVDRRADLFSAAATLFHLLTGRLPFAGESLVEMAHSVAYAEPVPLPPEIPAPLARVVMKGLQKSPAVRYASAAEMADALRAALSTADAPPVAAALDAMGRCARHPWRRTVGRCEACRRPLCRHCARRDQPPFYCLLHTPVTLFGVPLVRVEVALAAVAFLLLLLALSPLGYDVFRR